MTALLNLLGFTDRFIDGGLRISVTVLKYPYFGKLTSLNLQDYLTAFFNINIKHKYLTQILKMNIKCKLQMLILKVNFRHKKLLKVIRS
ncbi:hypothetical protein ES706_02386 [subsurface metagenome]